MRNLKKIIIVLLIIIIVIGGVVFYLGLTDSLKINRVLDGAKKGMEKEDINLLMSYVSHKYMDDYGFDYPMARRFMSGLFKDFDNFEVTINNPVIKIQDDAATIQFYLWISVEWNGSSAYIVGTNRAGANVRAHLKKEFLNWKVVKIEGVTQYRKGDRVSASHHVPCNNCHYCLNGHHTVCDMLRKTKFYPGGFAEYVLLPAINVDRGVYTLPDEVSYEDGSFVEPLACVFRGQRLAGLKPGSSVLVIGSGISGLLHIQLAQALGAGRIVATDINEFRLDAAKRAGANYTINALDYSTELLRDISDGRLADLVIICTGAATAINHGLESVERGGAILFFAATDKGVTIPISFNDLLFRNEVTLMSSYAGNRADHMTALDLIRSKRVRVKELITHRLDLEETELGFKLVAEGKNSIK